MTFDLQDLANNVTDEPSFVRFVDALGSDRADEVAKEALTPSTPWGPGANGWENGSIEAFLSAAAAWSIASRNGRTSHQVPDNAWRRCAEILLMGKHYE